MRMLLLFVDTLGVCVERRGCLLSVMTTVALVLIILTNNKINRALNIRKIMGWNEDKGVNEVVKVRSWE